jgi:hypothetical protein
VEGFPTLLFDFYQGMYELVSHLIETHRLTKIGYITGPEQSRSIRDRFQGYRDALQAHSIPYDPRLVVTGSIAIPSGDDAVHVFLDERRLRPGQEIEAIVGFYDFVAVDVQKALQRCGTHSGRRSCGSAHPVRNDDAAIRSHSAPDEPRRSAAHAHGRAGRCVGGGEGLRRLRLGATWLAG